MNHPRLPIAAHLANFAWHASFAASLTPQESAGDFRQIARVIQEHKEAYLVHSAVGNIWAEISGKMRHEGAVRSDFPAVGDWVVLRGLEHARESGNNDAGPVHIARILPRKTTLTRRVDAGHEQVLAVNVDIAFLGTSLNENFNLRRLERYLMVAREAGARPVVLLTKADLCEKPAPFIEEVRTIAQQTIGDASSVAILAISVVTGQGLDSVREILAPGVTAVILGSSGIGKSTLVNALADADIQDMMQVRDFDDKGRHCTTFRHLIRTRGGGLIIDTPGLRGLTLGEATDALGATFADIETLAVTCRFTNCRHETEPGCAIRAALESGALDPARLESYERLQREVAAMGRREHRVLERKQKKLDKKQTSDLERKNRAKWNDRHAR